MSYRQRIEDIVVGLREAAQYSQSYAIVSLEAHAQELIDIGIILDRLYSENERLTAIANLIDLAKERDELKSKIAELEEKIANGGTIR